MHSLREQRKLTPNQYVISLRSNYRHHVRHVLGYLSTLFQLYMLHNIEYANMITQTACI